MDEHPTDNRAAVSSSLTSWTSARVAQLGRAPALQAGRRRFDPDLGPQPLVVIIVEEQSACSSDGRTPAFQAGCPRFDPEYALQLLERVE